MNELITFELLTDTSPSAHQTERPGHSNSTASHILPTNLTSWKHPVHRWYNFIAGYSPEFVAQCIANSALERTSTVLDPFAGCGTTLVTALDGGLNAVGYEAHPFFYRIASAKTIPLISRSRTSGIFKTLSAGLKRPVSHAALSQDAWQFLLKLFPVGALNPLLGCRDALLESEFADDPLAFLVLSRLIDECSSAQTDGIYKAPTSKKRAHPPLVVLERMEREITSDVSPHRQIASARLYAKSSERMPEVTTDSIDLVVTSPPYLNNFDYAEMTRMHLYFWNMAGSWREITSTVRSKLITNTTTALKGHKELQTAYEEEICPTVLAEISGISNLLNEIKRTKNGRKDYDYLLRPYMAQITRVYREVLRCMAPGATAHTMIADAAFYGIHVPSPQWLEETLRWVGFDDVRCDFVRARGHRWVLAKRAGSEKGLGEYHIIARKCK